MAVEILKNWPFWHWVQSNCLYQIQVYLLFPKIHIYFSVSFTFFGDRFNGVEKHILNQINLIIFDQLF